MMTTSTNPTNCGAVLAAAQPTEIIGAPAPSVNPIRDVLRESAGRVRTHIAAGFTAAGRELLNARALCRHGEWLPYVEACGMTPRAAQRLMQAVRAIDAGAVPPDLSLRETLRLAAEPKCDTRDALVAKVRASVGRMKSDAAEMATVAACVEARWNRMTPSARAASVESRDAILHIRAMNADMQAMVEGLA